ncbi:MAG: minor capsid protein [Aminipila sp.]
MKISTLDLVWEHDFEKEWTNRFSKAQKFIDSEVLRLSNPYIPMQQGGLQESGILGTKIGSGKVIYNSPYARYQYYGKVMVGRAPKKLTDRDLVYHGAPMRGRLWFERMKADKKEQILKGAAKITKGD